MEVRERVWLAPLTTFKIGGPARFFISAVTKEDVLEAFAFAKRHQVPIRVLGGGSNLLVPDEGVDAVVLQYAPDDTSFEDDERGVYVRAASGTSWDTLVDAAGEKSLWGTENLAGIPGTVGGAVVQNIGAYGAELSSLFVRADVIDLVSGLERTIEARDAAFAYRTSFFKAHAELLILRVTLRLSKNGKPNLSYADVARAREAGKLLATPNDIAAAVREIRSRKFPDLRKEGTAGSFFKNPILGAAQAQELKKRFPELPQYSQEDGRIKASLAWLLDHALSLKGFSYGGARLYERQPLVIASRFGTPSRDVEMLAQEVERRVEKEVGLTISREVETFSRRER